MDKPTIEHASKGYSNAQETIRFIDQKSAFVSGLSTAFAGVTLAILSKLVGPADERFMVALLRPNCGHVIALIFLVVSLILCAACIVFVMLSVRASPPRADRGIEHSILFPYVFDPQDFASTQRAFEYYDKKLRQGIDNDLICREYADQLSIVGWILSAKREYHRVSVLLFTLQAVALLLGIVIGLITTDWSMFSQV